MKKIMIFSFVIVGFANTSSAQKKIEGDILAAKRIDSLMNNHLSNGKYNIVLRDTIIPFDPSALLYKPEWGLNRRLTVTYWYNKGSGKLEYFSLFQIIASSRTYIYEFYYGGKPIKISTLTVQADGSTSEDFDLYFSEDKLVCQKADHNGIAQSPEWYLESAYQELLSSKKISR
jgi:hypothetical protein